MAGRKQHYIPRAVLRGFLATHGGKTEKVWVFKKNRNPYVSVLEGVAAERDYYSPPSTNGEKTLDDIITDYESRLAALVRGIRELPVESAVDADAAAEVIAHLAPRNNHVRGVFMQGMELFADKALAAFVKPETLAHAAGLDNDEPTEQFRALMRDALSTNPELQSLKVLDVPPDVLGKILFTALQEGFEDIFAQQVPNIVSMLKGFRSLIGDAIEHGHRASLFKGIVPEIRRDDLRYLSWSIVRAPEEEAILPDCVAIAVKKDGEILPYIMTWREDVAAIVMPITPQKLLVGKQEDACVADLDELNRHAAECSHEFFVTAAPSDSYIAITQGIGMRSSTEFEQAVSEALESFAPPVKSADEVQDDALYDTAQNSPPDDFNLQVTFRDFDDQKICQEIANVVGCIVRELSRIMPTERLDGITFAYDYPAALRELDRGFPTSVPLETMSPLSGIGLAQAPVVLRDGVVKVRPILRGELGHALIGDHHSSMSFALHILVNQLGEAALIEWLDTAFPNFLLQPYADQYMSVLHPAVYKAIATYFGARASAGFGEDELFDSNANDWALAVFERAKQEVSDAKEDYAATSDVDAFFPATVTAAGDILDACSRAAGRNSYRENEALNIALRQHGLHHWFGQFQRDMNILWDRRGKWASIDEILLQVKHMERLLWSFGVISWKTAEGGIYVRIMMP